MRPARAGVVACALWALSALAVPLLQWPLWQWAVAGAVLAVLAAVDALLLWRQPSPVLERDVAAAVPLGPWCTVGLRLANAQSRPLRGVLHDGHPADWAVEGQPRTLRIAAREVLGVDYRARPFARGEARFEAAWWSQASPLRLWSATRRIGTPQALRVLPNFAPLAALALHTADQASRMAGAHLARRRGDGTEFHQMREYRTGDSLRQVDWKATARARRLISREYQEEKNQRVVLMLDSGRRMLAEDEGLRHFDHALNAALLLGWTALRQGDAVALQSFGAVDRFLPAVRGPTAFDRLIEASYDVQPEAVAADYLEAARRLVAGQPRRSLVVVCTNLRDEDADDLVAAMRLLQRRHLVCVASLREAVLDEVVAAVPAGFEAALRHAATHDFLHRRREAHALLRAQKIDVLDVRCAQLPAALVQHYLAVKRAGRL